MRKSTLISSVCRPSHGEATASYTSSRMPVWLTMLALVLALGACGTKATTDDAISTDQDTTDQEVGVTDDASDADASPDTKTNDITDKTDTAPDGDATTAACTVAADCQKALGDPDLCHDWQCIGGVCDGKNLPSKAGKACEDGQACSIGDTCDGAGTCKPGTGPNYQKDPTSGQINTCLVCKCSNNPDGTCAVVTTDTGATCDDNNACSKGDSCQAGGKCVGAVEPCADATTTCYTNVCDAKTGACQPQAKAGNDGAGCDDGDACTQGETCTGATCAAGSTVACDDKNPCTTDLCDKKLGCQFSPLNIPTGTTVACDDLNPCTENDKCAITGKCLGTDVTKGLQLLPCQVALCDKTTGNLTYSGAPDTTACDDGDPCTKQDSCTSQQCKGTTLVCNDGNPCTDDACDPKKCSPGTGSAVICGQCVAPQKADGQSCDDGNKCTSGDTCTQGACSGLPTDCNDNNACTNDSCLPGSGCLHTPVTTASFCDDGDNCTTVDKCVGTTCKGSPKDCTDTDPCTSDACDGTLPAASNCTHLKFDGPCNDGDTCTSNDLCTGGKCAGTKANCDDGNPCTNDLCDSIKGCTHIPLPGGSQCDDGLACTQNDYCDAGKCTQLPADNKCTTCNSNADCAKFNDQDMCNGTIKCIASYKGKVCDTDPTTVVKCDSTKDNSCTKNTCDPGSGVCSIVKFNAGTFCTGDKCLANAQCDGLGTCKGVALNCDDSNPCTTDSCDSTVGCKHASVTDGATCDDGSKCTPIDSCKAGKCVGNENTCACTTTAQCAGFDDGNLCNGTLTCQNSLCQPDATTIVTCGALTNTCQNNVCTPATGKCDPVPKADNVACDDANACTLGDTCQTGVCSSTTAANCDDGNPCTTDFCDQVYGCDHAPLASGGQCNDGNDCTINDSCKTGSCVGTQLNCDDSNQCTTDTCAKKGGCAHALDDTLTCTDGDPCTAPDHCKDGTCLSTPLNCDDNNSCTIDACDGNGGCKNVVVNGKDCDDGNACTVQDTCVNNVCTGKAKSCDDGNACTNDVCQNGVCVFTTATGAACTDNNECTGPDICTGAGVCAGPVVDCSTGTVCKVNLACSPVTGCVTVQADGALCDDGDYCTSGNLPGTPGDKCSGGGCSGPTVSCDDKNICTNDVCDAKLGCLITQNTCDDGNSCTVDTCDKVLGCQHQNVDGGFCDDGDACTDKTTCNVGVCGGGTPVVCDDKNDCTADSCDKTAGCTHVTLPDASTCTDNNVCTQDGCVGGACQGVALTCDDGNPCTVDSCNLITGCVHTDAAEGATCDDGEACTTGTVCQSGKCGGGTDNCSSCPSGLDKDCAWLDSDGNACNGTYRCVMSASLGIYKCKADPTIVACDSTGDGPCLHNTCDPANGKCSPTQSVNGASCQDGKGCTINDTCYNGVCTAGTLNDCAGAKDGCNGAACVEDPNAVAGFKCVAMPLDVTVSCDADGNGCTANDHCSAGKCVAGDAVNCAGVAGNCQVGTCKSTGVNAFTCQTSPAADNAACDDSQLCTVGDFCKSGKCQPGTGSYDCTAQSGFCSLGVCDKTTNAGFGACVPTPQNDGQPCDADSNGCTQGDKCVQGSCVPGTTPDCTASTTDCATGACKQSGTSTYTCVGAPKVDKLPCEADQNGCTVGDACLSGKCVAGPTKDCSAQTSADGCQVGTCQSLGNSQNTCVVVAATVGTVCNADGSGCTKGDACNALGACVPGPAVDCNTLTNACATGNCVSTSAQTFVCSGAAKPNGTVCDADGTGCTQNDACASGTCVAGAAVNCGVSSVQCVQKKCSSLAFDKYLCQDLAVADLTACDADSNGCTVGDSCYGGACAAGATQTCATYQKECSVASCASTGSSSFNCNVVAATSYGPLSPAVACVSTDSPTTCPTGYKCLESDSTTHAGLCSPTVQLTCNDGSACTTGDYCTGGNCVGGTTTLCDDKDPCTTDACDSKSGTCVYTPIAGCGKCFNETFDASGPLDGNMVVRSRVPAAANWAYNSTNADFEVTWNATTWADPAKTNSNTRLVARKLYIQSSGTTQLEFDMAVTGGSADCTAGRIDVLVNDTILSTQCATETVTHVTLPLTAWAGAPIDLVFQASSGPTKPTTAFLATVDNIKVTGMCSTTCVGVDFEPRGTGEIDTPYVMPQSWRATTTDATYVSWASSASAGHTGGSELVATWTGKPTSGTAQVAKMTIPQVSVVSGNALNFAVKTSLFDATCGADDLSVRVNTATGTVVELLKQCDSTSGWQVKTYDLSQFANTTVDIDIVVTTGLSTNNKGTVEIDDVAISGTCTYLCLSDDFESGGVAKWGTGTTDSVSKFKAWAASTVYAVSGTTSAFAQFDTNATDNKLSYMYGAPSKGTIIQLPVLGATMTAQINAFSANAPANCSTTASSGIYWFRLSPLAGGIAPPLTVAALAADLTEPVVMWGCDATSGWMSASWTASPIAAYDINAPSFYVVKQPGATSAKIYVDDVKVICQ